MRIVKNESKRKYACTECIEWFDNAEDLYTHQVRGHGWGKEDN